ncbi:DUF6114 domain-containing protein [Sphaerisporangium sp. NPDC088356]|uniref:DUF6114 domain-containing protein n=1 Tax=Sphaerisporangium sp. NPDC088356 TaxID=3154871 RepID=UPI0034239161
MKSWRRSRPFWGGLLTLLAGLELLSIPLAVNALPLVIHSAQAGLIYLISIAMIILGVLIWSQPAQRIFLGVMASLLSIMSILYANIGGFLLGMILGLFGGALSAAWTPITPAAGSGADPPARESGEEPRPEVAESSQAPSGETRSL